MKRVLIVLSPVSETGVDSSPLPCATPLSVTGLCDIPALFPHPSGSRERECSTLLTSPLEQEEGMFNTVNLTHGSRKEECSTLFSLPLPMGAGKDCSTLFSLPPTGAGRDCSTPVISPSHTQGGVIHRYSLSSIPREVLFTVIPFLPWS